MNENSHNENNKQLDISQMVMERIREENKWALPVHKHNNKMSNKIRVLSIIFAVVFLVGISGSFIFLSPKESDTSKLGTHGKEIITVVKSTDFAKTFTHAEFMDVQTGSVASIGEPHIYKPHTEIKVQIYWMLIILGISMLTMFFNWLSRTEHKDHT